MLPGGPGSDSSEEPVWGCEPAALDRSDAPRCPPGPHPRGVRWRRSWVEVHQARRGDLEGFTGDDDASEQRRR